MHWSKQLHLKCNKRFGWWRFLYKSSTVSLILFHIISINQYFLQIVEGGIGDCCEDGSCEGNDEGSGDGERLIVCYLRGFASWHKDGWTDEWANIHWLVIVGLLSQQIIDIRRLHASFGPSEELQSIISIKQFYLPWNYWILGFIIFSPNLILMYLSR